MEEDAARPWWAQNVVSEGSCPTPELSEHWPSPLCVTHRDQGKMCLRQCCMRAPVSPAPKIPLWQRAGRWCEVWRSGWLHTGHCWRNARGPAGCQVWELLGAAPQDREECGWSSVVYELPGGKGKDEVILWRDAMMAPSVSCVEFCQWSGRYRPSPADVL